MNLSEWRNCSDPTPMMLFLGPQLSERKLRLFFASCCRRHWDRCTLDACRKAIEITERFADGLASEAERFSAELEVRTAFEKQRHHFGADFEYCAVVWTAVQSSEDWQRFQRFCVGYPRRSLPESLMRLNSLSQTVGYQQAHQHGGGSTMARVEIEHERHAQAKLLRCIAGNPFEYTLLDPRCITSAVLEVTQNIYRNRDWHLMPILADLLEELGCQDDEILQHLRDFCEHSRGCWILDLILGR